MYNVNDYSLGDYKALDELYKKAANLSCKPDPNKFPRYKAGDYIDKDKSVNWNEEEVARRNQAYKDEVARLNRIRNKAITEVEDLIRALIAEDIKYSVKDKSDAWYTNAAKIIYSSAYDHSHSYGMYDILSTAAEYCNMIVDITRLT